MTDAQRSLVKLRPKATTVAAINARPMPHPTPSSRDNGYRAPRVARAGADRRVQGEDGDIHIVLFNRGFYVIAEMPAAGCLRGARAASDDPRAALLRDALRRRDELMARPRRRRLHQRRRLLGLRARPARARAELRRAPPGHWHTDHRGLRLAQVTRKDASERPDRPALRPEVTLAHVREAYTPIATSAGGVTPLRHRARCRVTETSARVSRFHEEPPQLGQVRLWQSRPAMERWQFAATNPPLGG